MFFSLLPPSISPLPHLVTCQLHIPTLLSFSFSSSFMWPQITILYFWTRLFSLYHLCLLLRLFVFCSQIILWSCHVIDALFLGSGVPTYLLAVACFLVLFFSACYARPGPQTLHTLPHPPRGELAGISCECLQQLSGSLPVHPSRARL